MSEFRIFVIAMAEFFQVISIAFFTLLGGYTGYAWAMLLNIGLPPPTILINGLPARNVLAAIIGAVIGFAIAATAAAIVFTFSQIERNTRSLLLRERKNEIIGSHRPTEPKF